MKYTSYQIICESNIIELENRVNDMLELGYQPIGGVICNVGTWYQAMGKMEWL